MSAVQQIDNTEGKIASLCSRLREDILNGKFKPGSRIPSQSRLSKQLGVPEATASAAVARLAHEGLAVRIRGRGSFVAENLPVEQQILDFIRMRRPPEQGEKPGTLHWIEWLTQAAQQAGRIAHWHHLFYEEFKRTEELLERFGQSKGTIIYGPVPAELPALLYHRGIPAVTVQLVYSDARATRYPQITYDRRKACRMATEHLISLGYTRIGFIRIKSPVREAGFLDALKRHGLAMRLDWFLDPGGDIDDVGDAKHKLCQELCEKMLEGPDRPEAMVCPAIHTAHVLELTALEMGLRIPEDLAIVGTGPEGARSILGNIPVPITNICFSVAQTCQKALELIEQIATRPKSKDTPLLEPIKMPLQLIIRDSCGAKLRGLHGKQTATGPPEKPGA